ncbi:DinB family protein [Paenibacillus vini]|uniref:DinB family protein n=1 Tax=Paenibacillus vini TaxID=1476024 RepID=UPI0025B6EDC6|nr:DinB family protein [Paenibacillus vini]MDN4067320.1 DinB family protein [Paenibacillus vini]
MSINSVDLLSIQKDNTWDREEWIVPLSVALQSVTVEQAEWTPPGGGNSIRETVNHINYYNKRILNRLKNIPSVPGVQTNEETFSNLEHPAGAEGWIATLAETERTAYELRQAISGLKDSDLQAPYSDKSGEVKLGEELSRWLLHDAYHAGQIVLIRRQQGSWRS